MRTVPLTVLELYHRLMLVALLGDVKYLYVSGALSD